MRDDMNEHTEKLYLDYLAKKERLKHCTPYEKADKIKIQLLQFEINNAYKIYQNSLK